VQVLLLPAPFAAVQLTVVRPTGKLNPEGGMHVTSGDGSQGSKAVTVKLTGTEHCPLAAKSGTSAGQLIVGT